MDEKLKEIKAISVEKYKTKCSVNFGLQNLSNSGREGTSFSTQNEKYEIVKSNSK